MKKRRVIVDKDCNEFRVMEGSHNMNTVIYTGSLRNCLNIKKSYIDTGEYNDESEKDYNENSQQ